ncbi:MAG: hypothetical protein ACKVTZ_10075 [Bacteroidia bacterium]
MKKSKNITLSLVIASVIASITSCKNEPKAPQSRLYMRADTTIGYSKMEPRYDSDRHYGGGYIYPYYIFSPYGMYHNYYSYGSSGGGYTRTGYYNSRTYQSSVAHNSPVARGGFGGIGSGSRGFSVGS